MMAKDTRNRVQIRFDLDMGKAKDLLLDGQIKALKQSRLFADHVRNGLRLMIDLSAGNVDVLMELFPWVADRFNGQPVQVAQQPVVDRDWFEQQVQLLRNSLLAIQERQGADPRPLAAPTLAMPQFEDDDGISQLIVSHKSDGSSAYNFSKSVMSLIQ